MSAVASPAVNTMSFEGKPVMLDVIRNERQAFYDLIDDPANWDVQTRCTEWKTRDIVGHMIDTTEGYLDRWEAARKGEEREMLTLPVMGEEVNKGAQRFHDTPREESIARLKRASDEMMTTFEGLSEKEWGEFLVPHRYMGHLPTLFYPAFQVMDYGVHTWDIRYGLGEKTRKLDERTAGVLIPFMFVLFSATVDTASAAGVDITYGIDVSGPWGGKWRVTVKDGKFENTPDDGEFAGCDAVFSYDPSDFVLTAFQRFPGGSARGDDMVIETARKLFFRI
jgi:uncharacterized protein (TIGR03083 family)